MGQTSGYAWPKVDLDVTVEKQLCDLMLSMFLLMCEISVTIYCAYYSRNIEIEIVV